MEDIINLQLVDVIFKVGTPLAILALAALSRQFVTRREFDELKQVSTKLGTAVALLNQRLNNDAYIKDQVSDLQSRVRSLEICAGKKG